MNNVNNNNGYGNSTTPYPTGGSLGFPTPDFNYPATHGAAYNPTYPTPSFDRYSSPVNYPSPPTNNSYPINNAAPAPAAAYPAPYNAYHNMNNNNSYPSTGSQAPGIFPSLAGGQSVHQHYPPPSHTNINHGSYANNYYNNQSYQQMTSKVIRKCVNKLVSHAISKKF